jgi:uncharacterized protein YebE (UPF0316 family)
MWYYDKVERIRPKWKASPLLIGSAIDEAVEHILLKKDGSYEDAFFAALDKFEVNGVDKTLPKDLLGVRFTAGDIDLSLFDEKIVHDFIKSQDLEMDNLVEFLEYCKQQRKAKTALETSEQLIFNFIAYTTTRAKGLLMLARVKEWIDENVVEVHSVQKKIEITNAHGDKFIGYLDFVATLKDGRKVLIDLKTSANIKAYYKEDSAEKSRQLGIYSQEEKLPDVAYLVVRKKILKKDPRVQLAFIEGTITEEHLDDIFDEIEEVTIEIKENLPLGKEAFGKNEDSCMNFGGCKYWNLCKKGSMKGMEKVK